jgi:hypothetical protein
MNYQQQIQELKEEKRQASDAYIRAEKRGDDAKKAKEKTKKELDEARKIPNNDLNVDLLIAEYKNKEQEYLHATQAYDRHFEHYTALQMHYIATEAELANMASESSSAHPPVPKKRRTPHRKSQTAVWCWKL